MKSVLMLAIMLQVVAVGVQVDPRDMWPVIRRPMWLLRVAIAMFVAVPVLAVILAKTFDIPIVMRGAMVLLAISAAAPLLPGKLLRLGNDVCHDATLAAVTSVLAIVLVPLELKSLGVAFQRDVGITVAAVAGVLMTTFLLPLGVGMVARGVIGPTRAVRIGDLAGDTGHIVLGILLLLMLVAQRATVFPLLWQSAIVIALFAAGALLIGHLLGGPDPGERTSLAIATVTRHPGLALLLASGNFRMTQEMPLAVVAFVLGTTLATIPYTIWRKRVLSLSPPATFGAPANVR
jgi:bile acid:Na+ symporter, BASS family